MILVDQKGHMMATGGEKELHTFARKFGIRRKWFQRGKHPHYDLSRAKWNVAKVHPLDYKELTLGLDLLDKIQMELDDIKKPDPNTKTLRDRLYRVIEHFEEVNLYALRLDDDSR